jgi:16S rRNA (cytosine1402-N4)-methyltransferase
MAGRGTSGSGAAGGPARHIPVLLGEVLAFLAPKPGGVYLDATFGAGGYSRAILQAADCRVVALDRDREAVTVGAALVEDMRGRLALAEECFSRMESIAHELGFPALDGIVFDLGVSSMQIDEPGRGFSFRHDGPLDMRMGREQGPSAADLVNTLPEAELARIFATLGEERRARAVARAIVNARRAQPIRRTGQLAEVVRSVVRASGGIDPATRSFQALRIFVNDELRELAAGLLASERLLKPGGRLVVVAFHSLEDRIVKTFLVARSGRPAASRHQPERAAPEPTFRLLTKKPVEPSAGEIAANPRARSAKLRAGERADAPARADDPLAALIDRLPSLGSLDAR